MDWQALSFDPVSSTPIYSQLSERLAAWIRDGTLPDGTRLLPTRELAGLLGLNRTTVAAAYEALESDGLLKAHVGRGSYVCSPGHRIRTFEWDSRFRASLPVAQTLAAAGPETVSFVSWRPEPAPWAIEALRRAASEAISGSILQLGPAEGCAPLREYLWSRMTAEGLARPEDDLLITSGCQQGLDGLGPPQDSNGDARDNRQRAFRSDDQTDQIGTRRVDERSADAHHLAVRQDGLDPKDVMGREPVLQAVRAS